MVSELYRDKEGIELSEILLCSLQTKDDFDDDVDSDDGHDIYPLYTILLLLLLLLKEGKVFPLQARCGPEGGYRYSSTLP